MKIIKLLLKMIFILVILFILVNLGGILYAYITPKFDIKSANAFYLYDSKDNVIVQGTENEKWIALSEMGPLVIQATISVEDKNFFNHNGFDFFRIGKSLYLNVTKGEIISGASTITQQYAKNLFLDFGQTWERKWKEMWLTYELETHYSKEEIIEGYLNTINYGHGNYGIGNAAKFYFNKEVKDLTLAEVTMLVGIPNNPSTYSPLGNFESARERQETVLYRMQKNGYITEEERQDALDTEIVFYGKEEEEYLSSVMYFKDAVMEELYKIDEIPKSFLETGGLKIYTTLDIEAQSALEKSVKNNIVDDEIQTAKVMMNPKDGSVLALIGGINYNKTQFNRVTDSIRQPGSIIKPFLYYAALENGFTASTAFLSSPTTFYFDNGTSYSPKNVNNVYGNKDISMATAIALSDNIYAVKTHIFLGENEFVNTLKEFGFTTKTDPVPALALGSYEINILEMAAAYSSLANLGKKVTPHLITKVEDINGNILYEFEDETTEVFDSSIAFIINELLTSTYDEHLIDYAYPTCIGMLKDINGKYALKSGSTDTDVWVVGYNPEVVLITWSGYDDNKYVKGDAVTANKKSWSTAIKEYTKNKDTTWYKMPGNVVGVLVDPVSGGLATNESRNKKVMYYIEGTQPTNNNPN